MPTWTCSSSDIPHPEEETTMADISFPAHITAERSPDIDGLPILEAQVQVPDDVYGLPLPAGPAGPEGPRGKPRSTFRKMGTIADAAARPTGLGPEDRGKWWHRLDDNGMDVWTEAGWRHSVDAVGPTGMPAPANTISVVETLHREELIVPAVEFIGTGADQELRVTAAAGFPGEVGPPGESGPITGSPDYETTSGPSHGGVFAYDRASRRFRSASAPLGTGPWGWYQDDFLAETVEATSRIDVASFVIPAQPFAWRPRVYGQAYVYSVNNGSQTAEFTVRLSNSQGALVACTAAGSGGWMYLPAAPCYRDGTTTRSLSPSSDYATVPAGQPATLVAAVERIGTGTGNIGFSPGRCSLVVYAEPTE
ncbi:hypothetical protein [Nocardia coubleae]|uniref:Uncharacterized protein n=1 Tax=Nocardia coubleae TaxID=356147 RepID=A0A846W4M3_9NOCA|nr:hypothetical protein [Nocardia coubleae]NKX87498.1 hypothetical protein [Nocardia coubleae]